jgi:hypothetical protein
VLHDHVGDVVGIGIDDDTGDLAEFAFAAEYGFTDAEHVGLPGELPLSI